MWFAVLSASWRFSADPEAGNIAALRRISVGHRDLYSSSSRTAVQVLG